MNHSDVESHMADYLEGDLSLDRRALFDAHLDSCEACLAEVDALRDTIMALKSLPDPEPPPHLVGDVMRRVRNGDGRAQWWDPLIIWLNAAFSPGMAVPVTAGATAVLILFVTGQLQLPAMVDETAPAAQSDQRPLRLSIRIDPSLIADPLVSAPLRREGAPGYGSGGADLVHRVRPRNPWVGGRMNTSHANVQMASASFDFDRPASYEPTLNVVSTRQLEPQLVPVAALSGRRPHTLGWDRALAPVERSGTARSTSSDGTSRSSRILDDRLYHLRRSPVRFARTQAQLSLAERELWAKQIARRAAALGQLDAIVQSLRSSGDGDAAELAGALEASVVSFDSRTSR